MGAFFLSLTALDPRGEPLGSNVLFICAHVSRCEVQYDYGLRQRRSKPLKSRPTSFKTEKGKEIVVEQKTAAKREKIVTAGTVSLLLVLLRKAAALKIHYKGCSQGIRKGTKTRRNSNSRYHE